MGHSLIHSTLLKTGAQKYAYSFWYVFELLQLLKSKPAENKAFVCDV